MITFALAALAAVATPSPACAPFRVMSYNIRLDLESDGINRWANRRDQFIGQIRLMDPAILGLQEVVASQKADLESAFPNYEFVGVGRDDGKSAGEFSNIAIDRDIFHVQSSGTFWLSPTPNVPSTGWDAAYIRIATWAHLIRKSDGKKFVALNSHFDNEGQQARLESARQIVRWIASNRALDEAVVVTGDLNTEPGTPPLQELTSATLGLRDARTVSKTPAVGPEGTWNDFKALPLPQDRMRIDFVLVDPKIDVERYGVLAWHGEGERVASDHFPIVADLKACRR